MLDDLSKPGFPLSIHGLVVARCAVHRPNVIACIDIHAIACSMAGMSKELLSDIDRFLRAAGIGEHRFGILAARNGRLVERLREGRRIWPDTEAKVREFLEKRGPELLERSRKRRRAA